MNTVTNMTTDTNQQTLLTARGITKKFGEGVGEVQVLKGIDMDLKSGELTLLMGPSGSGKTTLISMLGCLLTPTTGELTVGGERANGLGPEGLADLRRRHVGFVFQSYNLFPTLTALENLLLTLDVRNTLAADPVDLATRSLKAVGLGHRMNAYPSKMSGGEKQRVAIARTLVGSPTIMLADEPTAALDGENGKAVMQLLSDVARDNSRAVLVVTHDHRTLRYADRIIRIEDGRIKSDERPLKDGSAHAEEAEAHH